MVVIDVIVPSDGVSARCPVSGSYIQSAQFWRFIIDGREVAMSSFIATERADIGMRGLVGLSTLTGLKPALHEVEVEFNAPAKEGTAPADDRYSDSSVTFVTPIALTSPP
nr:hypothetical protein [uncultured Glaciecola sp.]